MKNRVAIAFNNKLGNFIFMTSAVQILRSWGYKKIDLITDKSFLKSPSVDLVNDVFNDIVHDYQEDAYDQVFKAGWSTPQLMQDRPFGGYDCIATRNIYWQAQGIHEVQAYLNMIGASWEDFEGYILKPANTPVLQIGHPRIALANCSRTMQSNLKRWNKFPRLSKILDDLGYEVILLGIGDELKGCVGLNFIDRLSIKETAKVLEQCDLLIAPSTGLAVVADAVKTPMLQLDGPIPTTKTHPIQSDYQVVRKYVACAPCFQSLLEKSCTDPICMDSISVESVIKQAVKMLYKKKVDNVVFQSAWQPKISTPLVCKGKVAYLTACFNRYHLFKEFLESFQNSNPQEGIIFFLNDASSDPRIKQAIEDFDCPDGIELIYLQSDYKEKLENLRKYKKMPSAHAYNTLFAAAFSHSVEFDYLMILDPDSIMHPYWVQKQIITFQEVKKHENIGLMSGFNNKNHPIYDDEKTSKIYSGSVSKYRLRNGVNLQFMMETSFFKEHGFYELETRNETLSSDLPKNEMLTKKGFKSIILVPSVLQQLGAYDSSLPRRRSNELAGDF